MAGHVDQWGNWVDDGGLTEAQIEGQRAVEAGEQSNPDIGSNIPGAPDYVPPPEEPPPIPPQEPSANQPAEPTPSQKASQEQLAIAQKLPVTYDTGLTEAQIAGQAAVVRGEISKPSIGENIPIAPDYIAPVSNAVLAPVESESRIVTDQGKTNLLAKIGIDVAKDWIAVDTLYAQQHPDAIIKVGDYYYRAPIEAGTGREKLPYQPIGTFTGRVGEDINTTYSRAINDAINQAQRLLFQKQQLDNINDTISQLSSEGKALSKEKFDLLFPLGYEDVNLTQAYRRLSSDDASTINNLESQELVRNLLSRQMGTWKIQADSAYNQQIHPEEYYDIDRTNFPENYDQLKASLALIPYTSAKYQNKSDIATDTGVALSIDIAAAIAGGRTDALLKIGVSKDTIAGVSDKVFGQNNQLGQSQQDIPNKLKPYLVLYEDEKSPPSYDLYRYLADNGIADDSIKVLRDAGWSDDLIDSIVKQYQQAVFEQKIHEEIAGYQKESLDELQPYLSSGARIGIKVEDGVVKATTGLLLPSYDLHRFLVVKGTDENSIKTLRDAGFSNDMIDGLVRTIDLENSLASKATLEIDNALKNPDAKSKMMALQEALYENGVIPEIFKEGKMYLPEGYKVVGNTIVDANGQEINRDEYLSSMMGRLSQDMKDIWDKMPSDKKQAVALQYASDPNSGSPLAETLHTLESGKPVEGFLPSIFYGMTIGTIMTVLKPYAKETVNQYDTSAYLKANVGVDGRVSQDAIDYLSRIGFNKATIENQANAINEVTTLGAWNKDGSINTSVVTKDYTGVFQKQDLKPTKQEWAESGAMSALLLTGGGSYIGETGSILNKLALAGITGGSLGVFAKGQADNWQNMTPAERGLAIAMDSLMVLGLAAGLKAKAPTIEELTLHEKSSNYAKTIYDASTNIDTRTSFEKLSDNTYSTGYRLGKMISERRTGVDVENVVDSIDKAIYRNIDAATGKVKYELSGEALTLKQKIEDSVNASMWKATQAKIYLQYGLPEDIDMLIQNSKGLPKYLAVEIRNIGDKIGDMSLDTYRGAIQKALESKQYMQYGMSADLMRVLRNSEGAIKYYAQETYSQIIAESARLKESLKSAIDYGMNKASLAKGYLQYGLSQDVINMLSKSEALSKYLTQEVAIKASQGYEITQKVIDDIINKALKAEDYLRYQLDDKIYDAVNNAEGFVDYYSKEVSRNIGNGISKLYDKAQRSYEIIVNKAINMRNFSDYGLSEQVQKAIEDIKGRTKYLSQEMRDGIEHGIADAYTTDALRKTFDDIDNALKIRDIEALRKAGNNLQKIGDKLTKEQGGELLKEQGRLLSEKADEILMLPRGETPLLLPEATLPIEDQAAINEWLKRYENINEDAGKATVNDFEMWLEAQKDVPERQASLDKLSKETTIDDIDGWLAAQKKGLVSSDLNTQLDSIIDKYLEENRITGKDLEEFIQQKLPSKESMPNLTTEQQVILDQVNADRLILAKIQNLDPGLENSENATNAFRLMQRINENLRKLWGEGEEYRGGSKPPEELPEEPMGGGEHGGTKVAVKEKAEAKTKPMTSEEIDKLMGKTESETKPKIKTEIKPETKTEVKPEEKVEIKPQEKTKISTTTIEKTNIPSETMTEFPQPRGSPYEAWVWEGGALVRKLIMPETLMKPMPGTQVFIGTETKPSEKGKEATTPQTTPLTKTVPATKEQPSEKPQEQPQPSPQPQPAPQPAPQPQPSPRTSPQPAPQPQPEPRTQPEPNPEPQPEPIPQPEPLPEPQPFPQPQPEPKQPIPPDKTMPPEPPKIKLPDIGMIPAEWNGKVPPGTIEWRQGKKWVVLPPPYTDEVKLYLDRPIPGTYKFAVGKGSAAKTLQVIGGPPAQDADIDMGWAQVHVSSKGKELSMSFAGGQQAANDRWAMEEVAMQEYERQAYQGMPEGNIIQKIPRGQNRKFGLQKMPLPQYSNSEYKVFLVNGQYIRDNLDVDFTQGGHYKVYPEFIPNGEVWIDRALDTSEDRKATLLHELTEVKAMGNAIGKDKAYEDAHNNEANPAEEEGRANPEKLDNMHRRSVRRRRTYGDTTEHMSAEYLLRDVRWLCQLRSVRIPERRYLGYRLRPVNLDANL